MYQLLTESINNPASRHSKRLIETCYKIALAVTWHSFSKKYKHLPSIKETISNIAVDTIAKVFRLDENGKFCYIEHALTVWKEPVNDDESAKYFLTKLISKIAGQEIINHYRSNDPLYGKILDSVNYHVKSEHYYRFCNLSNYYVSDCRLDHFTYRFLNHEETLGLPAHLFCCKEWHLKTIFEYLSDHYGNPAAIPLSSLVYKLKVLYINSFEIDSKTETTENCITISSVVNNSLNHAYLKLKNSYLIKGKLTKGECDVLQAGLKDLSTDLLNGGINPGLYEYLLPYSPEMSREHYQLRYRNIFEYLYKTLKSDIAQNFVN